MSDDRPCTREEGLFAILLCLVRREVRKKLAELKRRIGDLQTRTGVPVNVLWSQAGEIWRFLYSQIEHELSHPGQGTEIGLAETDRNALGFYLFVCTLRSELSVTTQDIKAGVDRVAKETGLPEGLIWVVAGDIWRKLYSEIDGDIERSARKALTKKAQQ